MVVVAARTTGVFSRRVCWGSPALLFLAGGCPTQGESLLVLSLAWPTGVYGNAMLWDAGAESSSKLKPWVQGLAEPLWPLDPKEWVQLPRRKCVHISH